MWHRLLGALLVVCGLTAGCYLLWCQHRASFEVMWADPAWPRPLPYPDTWLVSWAAQIDAANPVLPGHAKTCPGEWYAVQGLVRGHTNSAFALVGIGIAFLIWPTGRQSTQPSAILRGVAIGLSIGAAWGAFICYWTDVLPREFWLPLVLSAISFAITGAVVGTVSTVVPDFFELVGLCSAFCLLLPLEGHFRTYYALGVTREFGFLIAGVSGLLWGVR